MMHLLLRTAAVTLLVALPQAGTAHDWYPFSCCSNLDCGPIDEDEVTAGPEGRLIRSTGGIIRYDDARLKLTPRQAASSFHRCSEDGRPDGRTICLFVPQFGS